MSGSDPLATNERPSEFELNMSIPRDPRFAATVRELAVHVARYVGCSEARANAFGREVEEATRGDIETGGGDAGLPLVFRRTSGPVEVLINGRTLTAEP